jgi:hypothetical protein
MDLRRLRAGEWIAGLSGLVVLVSLFLPWYGDEAGSRSGWESLGALDLILAVLALAALAIPVVTAVHRVPAVPLAHESLVTLVAAPVWLFVVFRVLNLPDWAAGREWGLWAALLGTLGILVGALIAMRDERLTREGRHTDLTGVPVSAPREIETLPAPRPEARP